MCRDLAGRRVLLLQGPNGPFFRRLADDLRARGCTVTKVNFNSGDDLFYRGPDVVRFRERLDDWPAFFRALVAERRIEAVLLFGDGRPLHQSAVRIAEELGVSVWAFEEGYLRPDHVTIERGGVNGNSRLPRDPDFYRNAAAELPELPAATALGNTFWPQAGWTVLNACAVTFGFWRYPRYRHHRDVNAFRQAFYWTRGAARKLWYRVRERGLLERLVSERSGRYFLVPLQVHCDGQLQHSRYSSVEEMIEEVVAAFAAHAPADSALVVKHHPHDRPYRHYGSLLGALGRRHGCADRIVYLHDQHLPTLLKHARGVITMNSTAGISALHHGTPVKVLGRAVYDIAGLTSQQSLPEFLAAPEPVDAGLFASFVRFLREDDQVNGSFYKRLPVFGTASGLDGRALPAVVEEPRGDGAAPPNVEAGPVPVTVGPSRGGGAGAP